MTELWTFSKKEKEYEIENEDDDEEQSNNGGLSVSQFFCKKKPSVDSQQYPFFEPFIVPHGLVYFPECIINEQQDKNDEEEDAPSMCTNFDKLFYMAAVNLGKSKSKSEITKTRKKITQ